MPKSATEQDTIQGRQDLREVAQQRQLSRQEYQLAVQQALQTAEQDAQTYLAKIESRMMMYALNLQLAPPLLRWRSKMQQA